jgi:hypothetical protein
MLLISAQPQSLPSRYIRYAGQSSMPALPLQSDDDLPLVVLDRDADLDALPAVERLGELTSDAQDYLRASGVTDERTWSAFRIDQLDDALIRRLLRATQLNSSSGLWMPTFDPRDPATILGLIRMTPAQHQHRFVTKPVGIAGDPALVDAKRIVLIDYPLQAMRLHQHGIAGVAVVEDVAVLPPLIDWLRDRELVVAGFRERSRARLIAALGPLGVRALNLTLLPDLERSPAASLTALGIGRTSPQQTAVTPHLLRDLCAYARGRITAGAATAALRSMGITDPSFVAAFGIGYLPSDVRSVLSADQRDTLLGLLYPDAVLVPAFDAQGVVVDLLLVPADPTHPPLLSLHPEPCGLIAPAVTTAFDAVVVVDNLRAAFEHFTNGQKHVVLLRGLPDAQVNAPRLAANGVRRAVVRCLQDREAIAACLTAAGITVADTVEAPPAQPDPDAFPADISLQRHDAQAELATFAAGELTYIVEVPWDDRTLTGIRIQRGIHEHLDRIDLGAEPQRRRCSSSAALRTGAPALVIAGHLAQLHTAIAALAERATAPADRAASIPTLPPDLRAEALALAQAPDLLARIVADLATGGWVGEASAQQFTVLAAISRLTDDPIWMALSGPDAVGVDVIAAFTPPEETLRVSRLTDATFYHADPAALRHKLLIIDDASRISAGVATALRVLKRRGALSASRIASDPVRGQTRTAFVEVHGPIAVITAADDAVDPRLQGHLVTVASDESPAQVEAVLAARRQRAASVGAAAERERISTRWRNLQRVLAALPVVIPFAAGIPSFGTSVEARRDHDLLLTLLAAHALLHQHQRTRIDGTVVATEADLAVASALIAARRSARDDGLSRHGRQLLAAITAARFGSFTMEDLDRLLPEWTRYTCRSALDELMACDFISSPRSGRGIARTYRLHAASTNAREVGELATVGETHSPTPKLERNVG